MPDLINIKKLSMETLTVEQLQENFDEIFESVEKDKKSYYITDENGDKFILMPYSDNDYYKEYFQNNNEAP